MAQQIVTGSFEDIRLDFTRDETEPLQDYLHLPAYLHIYMNGTDIAENLPSAYLFMTLGEIVGRFSDLIKGRDIRAKWWDSPWQFDLHAAPEQNVIFITLHMPDNLVLVKDVSVSLDHFSQEVINVTHLWLTYLDKNLHKEVIDPKEGRYFRQLKDELQKAEQILEQYRSAHQDKP
jgi:hypothetical protein